MSSCNAGLTKRKCQTQQKINKVACIKSDIYLHKGSALINCGFHYQKTYMHGHVTKHVA